MINIKAINARKQWLIHNIPILQEELTALTMLTDLYEKPEYHTLQELQDDCPKSAPKKPQIPEAPIHPKEPLTPKELYTKDALVALIKARPQYIHELLRATIKPIQMPQEGKYAKKVGMSSNTLNKVTKSLIHHGWLKRQRDGRQVYYKVPREQVDRIRNLFPIT